MKNKFLGTGGKGFNPIRKVSVALRGLYYAVIFDFAVAYKILLSAVLMIVFFYYRQWLDFGLVLVATGLMIVAEIFNTAIEALCDFIEINANDKIGIIKDISAGGVGISIFVWLIIVSIETYRVINN